MVVRQVLAAVVVENSYNFVCWQIVVSIFFGEDNTSTYLETTQELYREAALAPQASLCCSSSTPYALPGLVVPEAMTEMNYGCGTTVSVRDMRSDMTVLYVGIGGDWRHCSLPNFTRRLGSVIAVDNVPEMREKRKKILRWQQHLTIGLIRHLSTLLMAMLSTCLCRMAL